MVEVGGVSSSGDLVPDLWFGEPAGERMGATSSAAEKSNEGRGDGSQRLSAPGTVRHRSGCGRFGAISLLRESDAQSTGR
jgi:hypothetical protein